MKIRTGFVSNSSSSSFLIAYKGELKLQLDKALKLSLPENYPLPEIANLADVFMDNVDTVYKTFNDYDKKCGYYDSDETEISIKGYFDQGFTVATGGFSDDYGQSLTSFLCGLDIDYKSDNLIIYQSGGY